MGELQDIFQSHDCHHRYIRGKGEYMNIYDGVSRSISYFYDVEINEKSQTCNRKKMRCIIGHLLKDKTRYRPPVIFSHHAYSVVASSLPELQPSCGRMCDYISTNRLVGVFGKTHSFRETMCGRMCVEVQLCQWAKE